MQQFLSVGNIRSCREIAMLIRGLIKTHTLALLKSNLVFHHDIILD